MFVSIVKELMCLFVSVHVCLASAQDPPLSVVRKFAHLLEQSNLDLQEEQEVIHLREEVVTKIRANQQMEKDLNLMDIKIGLLVKNRITLQVWTKYKICKNWNGEDFATLICWYLRTLFKLKIKVYVENKNQPMLCILLKQDVVSLSKKMKSKKNKMAKEDLPAGDKQGIKGLSKEKRRRLEAYQHLFYLLQVRLWLVPSLHIQELEPNW